VLGFFFLRDLLEGRLLAVSRPQIKGRSPSTNNVLTLCIRLAYAGGINMFFLLNVIRMVLARKTTRQERTEDES
jgi:hypothetical protein